MGYLVETDFKHRIYSEGEEIAANFSISPDKIPTVEEILRSSRAFVNLIGKHTGDVGDVANISFGIPRYEDRPFDSVATRLARYVMGNEAEIVPLGENQLLVLIESDLEPDEFLERFVSAPVQTYGEDYEDLRRSLGIIEGMRREDVLDPTRGKGKTFKDIFYGRLKEKIRAFQRDGRISMVWNSWYDGEDLTALHLDDEPQKMKVLAGHHLAEGAIENGIIKKEDFFRGESKRHRYGLSIYWDPSVDCCRFSTNAQMGEANFHKTDESIENSKVLRLNQLKIFGYEIGVAPFLQKEGTNNICKNCKKNRNTSSEQGGCKCE